MPGRSSIKCPDDCRYVLIARAVHELCVWCVGGDTPCTLAFIGSESRTCHTVWSDKVGSAVVKIPVEPQETGVVVLTMNNYGAWFGGVDLSVSLTMF